MLLYISHHDLNPTHGLTELVQPYTNLLPPQELNPLTERDLMRLVPKPTVTCSPTTETLGLFSKLRGLQKPLLDDEFVLPIWPAREGSGALDLQIRSTRLRDTYYAYCDQGKQDLFWIYASQLLCFDYTSLVNILNAAFLLRSADFSWFDFFSRMGAFKSNLDHYVSVCKVISDKVKKYKTTGFPRTWVVECQVMSGYRNAPFPGFNLFESVKELAGTRKDLSRWHGLTEYQGKTSFAYIADTVIRQPGVAIDWQSSTDYVRYGDWETSGASSIGRVNWNDDGKIRHFKARKNLVRNIMDADTVVADFVTNVDQINVALGKAELAKHRPALAGDIYTYWRMAWIDRFTGDMYNHWPGSTLNESAAEESDRMATTLSVLRRGCSLAFDFEGFDRQPTLWEIETIVRAFINCGRSSVPPDHLAEYDNISAEVLKGVNNAVIKVKNDADEIVTLPVYHGVMSGTYWTSKEGNAWGTIIACMIEGILAKLGVPPVFRYWIRGDDTLIASTGNQTGYVHLLLFRLGYEAVDAIGNDSKYGIFKNQGEFLRRWLDARPQGKGYEGYPTRSIPNWHQQKPWNSTPRQEEDVMRRLYDVTVTLRRRGVPDCNVDSLWRGAKRSWSQRRHLTQTWLSIPRSLGGLGIEPWDGRTVPTTRWPKPEAVNIDVVNKTDWAGSLVVRHYSDFLPVTASEAASMSETQFMSKLAMDDIPTIRKKFREAETEPLKSDFVPVHPLWWNAHSWHSLRAEIIRLSSLQPRVGEFKKALSVIVPARFGLHYDKAAVWQDYAAVARERKVTAMSLFKAVYPDFTHDVFWLCHRGLTRTQAVDWLFGSLSSDPVSRLHPQLLSILSKSIAVVLGGYISNRRLRGIEFDQLKSECSRMLEQALCTSCFSKQIYSW